MQLYFNKYFTLFASCTSNQANLTSDLFSTCRFNLHYKIQSRPLYVKKNYDILTERNIKQKQITKRTGLFYLLLQRSICLLASVQEHIHNRLFPTSKHRINNQYAVSSVNLLYSVSKFRGFKLYN